MSTFLALSFLAVVALALAVPMIRKRNVLGQVDRFQHARSLTTAWSSQPPVEPQQQPTSDE